MLGVAFFGELAIMLVLPYLLPAGTSDLARTLIDASLLTAMLTAVILPLLLHLRRRSLRVARRALRLQYTLDQHAIVSMTDVTGRITFANDRFCRISGYSRQELLGQEPPHLKSGEHPPEVYEDMWRTIANGSTWNGDVCNRNKTGGFYWVHATITPFLKLQRQARGVRRHPHEITAQKALEKVSQRQEAWLRTILDNLGEGVYTLDARGKVDYLNAEGERLIGWRLEELAGKGLHDIIHHHRPDGAVLPAAECPIHLAMRDRRVYRSSDEVFFHKDGSSLPVKVTGRLWRWMANGRARWRCFPTCAKNAWRCNSTCSGRQERGRGRDAPQGRLPVHHELRNPHAAEWRHRHDGPAARYAARQRADRVRPHHQGIRRRIDGDHQRHPRLPPRSRPGGWCWSAPIFHCARSSKAASTYWPHGRRKSS